MFCNKAVWVIEWWDALDSGRRCPVCGEELVDVLLDWEDELRDYQKAVDLSERWGAK